MTRILSEHFANVRKRLLAYSTHLGLSQHGDVKGLAREGVVRQYLATSLPSDIEFKTGEIFDEKDRRSGQLDIVLQNRSWPRIHLFEDIQLTMNDAAIGVIEVKSTLTTGGWESQSHLKSALDSFRKVKELQRSYPINAISGRGEKLIHERTPCFLFAYSGPSTELLSEKLISYGTYFGLHPDQYMPEVCVVLDRGYYICRDNGWLFPTNNSIVRYWPGSQDECLVGLFVYICQLAQVINNNSPYSTFSNYFGVVK